MPPSHRPARLAAVVIGLSCLPAAVSAAPDDLAEPPPRRDVLVIPLHVHILTASDMPEVDCRLTDADVQRVVAKVNGIWRAAGLHFGLASLTREPAARRERFRLVLKVGGKPSLGLYHVLIPDEGRSLDGAHVYYVHDLPVNGVWFRDGCGMVRELAKLRAVEGGIDEPIPRVTAHELAHMLDLEHRQDETNLLASGTTGTRLNRREAETARAAAKAMKGVLGVGPLRLEALRAEAAGDTRRARQAWTWLAEVPGGDDEPRRHLEALEAAADARESP